MKKKLKFIVAAIFIFLIGYGIQTTFPVLSITGKIETVSGATQKIKTALDITGTIKIIQGIPRRIKRISDIKEKIEKISDVTKDIEMIEKQLQVILDNMIWPPSQDIKRYPPMYLCLTDLDQNGRMELISAQLEGSGKYTYSDYKEVNENLDDLRICNWVNKELESEADIVMLKDIPVYYDLNNEVYYYIFNDIMKDGQHLYYENKRAVSLKNGKLSEQILAYKTSWYQENVSVSSPIAVYKDADGNEISEREYITIADTVFSDFIKKEAHFSWIYINNLDFNNLNHNILKDIVQKSYNEFLIY